MQRMAGGTRSRLFLAVIVVAAGLLVPHSRAVAARPNMSGLHVVENRFENADDEVVRLLGVNRNDSHYLCRQAVGQGFFDGADDDAGIEAMETWGINTVRVPIAEDCWLNNEGIPQGQGGAPYRQAIRDHVALLTQHGMAVILDNHGIGGMPIETDDCPASQPFDDAECDAPRFWREVANTFKGFSNVLFEPYNEPIGGNDAFGGQQFWECWRDGGNDCATMDGPIFDAVGMQRMVDVIRATGARNVILLSGIVWANDLSRFLEFAPVDPLGQLAASAHLYKYARPNSLPCRTVQCYEETIAPVAAEVPVVIGEFGQVDCKVGFSRRLMDWADENGVSYLAWAWVEGPRTCRYLSVIRDYSGTPRKGYGRAVYTRLRLHAGIS